MSENELSNSNTRFKITQTVDVHNEMAIGLTQTLEKDYHALFKNTLNGVVFCRAILDDNNEMIDWIYLDCNAAYEREMGIPREKLIGNRVTEVLPGIKEKDRESFECIGKVAANGGNVQVETYVATMGKWLSVYVYSPARGFFAAITNDITQYIKIIEGLKDSTKQVRDLAKNTVDWLYVLDPTGRYTYVSPRSKEILGYEPAELLGKTPLDFMTSEELQIGGKQFTRAISSQQELRGFERQFTHKDGHTVVLEGHMVPFFGTTKSVTAYRCLDRDITERREVEQNLQRREFEYHSLFENMRHGFTYCRVIMNEYNHVGDFIYLEVNKSWEQHTGLARGDVVGKLITEIIPEIKQTNPELFDFYHQVAIEDKSTTREIFWIPLQRWFSVSAYCPQRGYVVALWDDITERKRIEQALHDSKEELQLYAGMIIDAQENERKRISRELHDGIAQSLTSLYLDIENLLSLKGEISENASVLLRRMECKIEASVDETRQMTHELSPVYLEHTGLIDSIESLIHDMNRQSETHYKLELHGRKRKLLPNTELALFRIAQEALRNVYRHSKATECIVQIELHKNGIRMTISDNGLGLKVPKRLTSFARAGNLGIIDMMERANLLNGTFGIDSRVNKGTRVHIELPLSCAKPESFSDRS